MTYQSGYSRQDPISALDHKATIATCRTCSETWAFNPTTQWFYSDVHPDLSFDFGDFKLFASCVTNLSVMEVVLFTGIWATPRTFAMIEFELPRRVIITRAINSLDCLAARSVFRPTTV